MDTVPFKLMQKFDGCGFVQKCIRACKERFSRYPYVAFYFNDGKSLDMVSDRTIDFTFSFDSLVHVEDDVVEAYVNQLTKKLKRDGVAFMHHSNLGEYKTYFFLAKKSSSPKAV